MNKLFLVYLCCATCVLSARVRSTAPKVVIIGAGVAGIAAASRLFENGFTDVKILEAENRIGGRIHSVQLGDYMADLGAQWVGGEKGNAVFELAWPLGFLERSNETYEWSVTIFGSSGSSLSDEISYDFNEFADTLIERMQQSDIEDLTTGSFGEFADAKFDEYMKSHPEISKNLHYALRQAMNMRRMSSDSADSWYDVSAKSILNYADCEGDTGIHWKHRTWSTILDILMKKIPNPKEELPVLRNTYLDSEVTRIDFTKVTDPMKITTANGKKYLADHIIYTPSLGVLKATYVKLFKPPLPPKKTKSIKSIAFGHGAKIVVYNKNPWWHHEDNELNQKIIFWTDEDRKKIQNDPAKEWMLGINTVIPVEYKPELLNIWVSSNYSIAMESIPEKLFRNQVSEFIHQFFGKEYKVTEITEIKRSMWNTNKNFRGAHSYRGLKADIANVRMEDLAEPILHKNTPVLQFAGEATAARYGSVNGAIESGWREADRLIDFYGKKKTAKPHHRH